MVKFSVITIVRTSTECQLPIGRFPSVVCLCDLAQELNQLSDLMTLQLGFWLQAHRGGGGGDGVSHEALVNCRQAVHQGLNLFSQFCFPKGFSAGFLLSRCEDPHCQGQRPAVTVVPDICTPHMKKQHQCVCSFTVFVV